jgi:hypothetical protein
VVQSPAYRDDKTGTTLDQLLGLLVGQQGPRLVARAGTLTIQGPPPVLVSSNVYGMGDLAGLGVGPGWAVPPLGCSRSPWPARSIRPAWCGAQSGGLTRLTVPEVVVDADASQISVGVGGEALLLTPRAAGGPAGPDAKGGRPGVPDPKPIMDWRRLWQMALFVPG